jgi:tRNA-2-methylthio-N6-dimethylallyladenosine synthase
LESPCAFLTIQQGCDKFCTFCIVPYTRGRERSKPLDDVLREARRLVSEGAKQITLLGQNVNSYRDGDADFARLLRALDEVDGLERLFFTSSYPRDMTDDVLRAIAECKAPVEFLHFPVQSGSDRVLKRMKRRHTVDWYLRKVDDARRLIPDLQLSTDLIVGFPGETEEDFQGTLDVMRQVRFDQVYAFKFSPREGTPAATLPDPVAEDVKSERLARLFDLHENTVQQINAALVGSRQEVLVENAARDGLGVWGRTRGNKNVTVLDCEAPAGTLLPVEISASRKFALVGRSVSAHAPSSPEVPA